MTFDVNGQIVLSTALSVVDVDKLALKQIKAKYSLDLHEQYLAFHRNEIFIP